MQNKCKFTIIFSNLRGFNAIFIKKNTSIRIQVLLPVVLTALALFISLGFTASTLEEEQDIIASNTDSFVFYKDQLAKVDDEVYPLRISAVYAIYDTDRRANFTAELRNKVDDINVLLDELEARKTFAKEVNLVRTNINNYVQFSHKVIEYLNKKKKVVRPFLKVTMRLSRNTVILVIAWFLLSMLFLNV